MSQALSGTLKKTPLNARHRSLGARMVEFGGWDMPVEYSGIVRRAQAVRTRAGLFDVSHMGEIEIAGRDALKAVQHITSNDASRLAIGQAQYSALTTPQGTFVDDVLTYKLADEHFMLVVNASNIMKDFNWITAQIAGIGDAVAVNTSSRYALIALQGPAARDVLQTLTGVNLGDIKYYWFTTGEVAGVRVTISRTGYTGEDGFEVFVPPASAERVWDAILARRQAGRRRARRPRRARHAAPRGGDAALRQRHRRDDDRRSRPTSGGSSAGRKTSSSAHDVLRRQKQEGVARKLVGFEVLDRAIARHGYDVYVDGQKAGVVTSGTQTPFLKKAIGMAYLPSDRTATGHRVRDRRPRPARARAGRAAAVLQASGIQTTS